MEKNQIVPFGKYRGQPIEVLQADPDYVEWLRAQGWFSQKYHTIYTLIVNHFGEPTDTPEHNALQARFLFDAFRREVVAAWAQRVLTWWHPLQSVITIDRCLFEDKGWDVCLTVIIKTSTSPALDSPLAAPHHYRVDSHARQLLMGVETFPLVAPWMHGSYMADQNWIEALTSPSSRGQTEDHSSPLEYWGNMHLELKPAMGDDYPSVLRAMLARTLDKIVRGIGYCDAPKVLLIDAFTARGATLAQVREIFALSHITLLTLADLTPVAQE